MTTTREELPNGPITGPTSIEDIDYEVGQDNVQFLGLDIHNPVFLVSALAPVLNNIGFILASEGQPTEALEYCSRALEMEPKRESFWDSMGFVQMKSGDYREAARSFLTAVELNPTFPDAWRHLLHVYHKEGQTDRLAGAKSYVARILPDQLARFEREQGAEIAD